MYKETAEKEGISLEACTHKVREFSLTALPGDYRRLMHRPEDLRWQLLVYDNANQELGHTDLDALRGNPRPAAEPLAPGMLACSS